MRPPGFTLIELLIVVAIIGILAAIAVPQYGNYLDNAAENACRAEARAVASTIAAARVANDTDNMEIDAHWSSSDENACVELGFAGENDADEDAIEATPQRNLDSITVRVGVAAPSAPPA